MNNFQFQYISFVWLLAAIVLFVLLFLMLVQWKKRVARRIGRPSLMKAMLRGNNPRRAVLKFMLICLAFTMGVLAVMNLRKTGGSDGIVRKGIDLVFALDASKSMLATDMAPNRLEAAKQLIGKLIDALPEIRVGIVLFAGKAYVQMPLSMDHGAAQMYIDNASPDAVPIKGTVIGDALKASLDAFGEREAKYKAVVLLTDGEGHDESAVQLSKELSQRGLMVNTVGIGSLQGSYIPEDSLKGRKIDPETGVEIVSKLNELELKQIADNTNGVYVRLQNSKDVVRAIVSNLSHMEQKVSGDMSLMSFTYYFWIFVALMLTLLMGEQLLPEGKRGHASDES